MSFLVALASLLVLVPARSEAATVRIGLFTLFKPEAIEVRLAEGKGAILHASGIDGGFSIGRGESIAIRRSGSQLLIALDARRSFVSTQAHITPLGESALELSLPGKIKRSVRGELLVDAGAAGRSPLRIVLTTQLEAAVASVVAAESNHRETEALKSLAVVVRTFMLAHPSRHASEGFDFCDTTHCQFYRGEQYLSEESTPSDVEAAVASTRGEFLSFEGRAVDGYYTAACGGMTVTPSMLWGGGTSYPYRRVACRWCRGSHFDKWERSAGAIKVFDALSEFIGGRFSQSAELTIERDDPSGFVKLISVADGPARATLTADAFRRAIGLKLGWNTVLSATFTIERRGQRLIFRGRGFGSQIGLCEAGSAAQAAAGRTYREILSFYYPGAEVSGLHAND
jgi:stage II sporulation protein D